MSSDPGSLPVQAASGEFDSGMARQTVLERLIDRLSGLRPLINHDEEGSLSPEGFLLMLIRASRRTGSKARSDKDLARLAGQRRRYLGTRCVAAGPFMGAATRLADLYCEAATLSELAELYRPSTGRARRGDRPCRRLMNAIHGRQLFRDHSRVGAQRALCPLPARIPSYPWA